MARKKAASFRCPTCRKIVLADDPDIPFCSDRCRVIDLGKWVSGGYVISSPVNDPESGGLPQHANSGRAGDPEAEYNEQRERRIGGVRKGPESSGGGRSSDTSQHAEDGRAGDPESEDHGRRKPN